MFQCFLVQIDFAYIYFEECLIIFFFFFTSFYGTFNSQYISQGDPLTPQRMKASAPSILSRAAQSPELRERLARMRRALAEAAEELEGREGELEEIAAEAEREEEEEGGNVGGSTRRRRSSGRQMLGPQHSLNSSGLGMSLGR